MRSLEITTQIGCRNRCSYCPIDKLVRIYKDDKKIMSLEDFENLLKNVPKDVRIDFSGFSEVFLNVYGSHMIRYAINQGYIVTIYTTLEGFTSVNAEILKDLYIPDVFFHQYDSKGFDQKEFDRKMDLFISKIGCSYRTSTLDKPYQWSRAGNVWDTERKIGNFECSPAGRDFDHNVVLPNGDVYLCCMDWSLKHKLGNLNETHFDKLQRGKIVKLSEQENSEVICRYCELCKLV
jgi:radical SAM protein with 4Fe4S-binding SPASM domain